MKPERLVFRKLHAGQREIYNQLGMLNVLRCGRRFGKTELLETRYAKRAITGRKIGWFTPDYKLMRPTYRRMHQRLSPLIKSASRTESIIELYPPVNGNQAGLIEFWSLDNEDAGRSRDYDDVVIDEASLVKKGLREIVEQAIMPTLLDRRGTLTMAGTPKGIDAENYFYVACTDKTLGYREFHAPTRDNPTLDPIGVATLQDRFPPLVYQQEYLAEFVDWSGEAFFSLDKLLYSGHPIEFPDHCDTVFAVVDTATKTKTENDGTGVVFASLTNNPYHGPKVILLDYDLIQIEGALLETWLPSVYRRLDELAVQCKARFGASGVSIEDKASGMILLQQAARRNWPAHAIDSKLTSLGKVERAISVSGYVFQDLVKISRLAHDKIINYKGISKNHLLSQVTGFRVGVKDQVDDDLLDCFCYVIALALGNNDGF